MIKVIILLSIFVVFMYVYNMRKIKKRKESTRNINSIQDFHNTYGHLLDVRKREIQKQEGNYTKYVTKYNSSLDYREKL